MTGERAYARTVVEKAERLRNRVVRERASALTAFDSAQRESDGAAGSVVGYDSAAGGCVFLLIGGAIVGVVLSVIVRNGRVGDACLALSFFAGLGYLVYAVYTHRRLPGIRRAAEEARVLDSLAQKRLDDADALLARTRALATRLDEATLDDAGRMSIYRSLKVLEREIDAGLK